MTLGYVMKVMLITIHSDSSDCGRDNRIISHVLNVFVFRFSRTRELVPERIADNSGLLSDAIDFVLCPRLQDVLTEADQQR